MNLLRALALLAGGWLALAATAEPLLSMPGAPLTGWLRWSASNCACRSTSLPACLRSASPAERASVAKAAAVADKRLPLQVGFARAVPADVATVDLAGLDWQSLGDGGRAARIVVESPGAAAIRVELLLAGETRGLMFRFAGTAPGAPVFGPYTWAELPASSRWTPILEGAAALIDIEAAPGTALAGTSLTAPRISHLFMAGADLAPNRLKGTGDVGSSGSCNVDLACISNASSDLILASASVARIIFTSGGSSYFCTGSLLNSRNAAGVSQQIPYFVTANHCIGSSAAASTINFYWFFQAATCDSRAQPGYQLTPGGASLLYSSYDVDLTLLRMNNNPPQGTFLAGWNAEPVFPGASVVSLHHPNGDLKKVSAGQTVDYAQDADDVQTPGTFVPQGTYLRVSWSLGTTEGGSSGGGVYTRATNGQYQLRGVLHGGEAACDFQQGLDYFSRFDLAYPAISQHLAGVPQPSAGSNAIEYYNVDLDHYFLTSFPEETQAVESGAAGRGWVRTGYAFKVGAALPFPGYASVCRFYGNPQVDPATGRRRGPNSHFYTADAGECAQVKKDAGWIFETGNAFATQVPLGASCPANTVPVFRLYNNGFAANNSNHRYTTSAQVYQFMLTQKWLGEQTVMCAPVPG